MKNLITIILLCFVAITTFGQQPVFYDADTVEIAPLGESSTLKPGIACLDMFGDPIDTFRVGFWDMALPGGGGDPGTMHDMGGVTDGLYRLGVDDSHILQPGSFICAICEPGLSYTVLDPVYGVNDSMGIITAPSQVAFVPPHWFDFSGSSYPDFVVDEVGDATALGQHWSWRIWMNDDPMDASWSPNDDTTGYSTKSVTSSTASARVWWWDPAVQPYIRLDFTFKSSETVSMYYDFSTPAPMPMAESGGKKPLEAAAARTYDVRSAVYPTLASSEVNLIMNVDGASEIAVQVFDASGREVFSRAESASQLTQQLDVCSLPAGTYIVKWFVDGQVMTDRFVKI